MEKIICWIFGHKRTYEGAVYQMPYTGYGKYYCSRCGIGLKCLHKDGAGDNMIIISRINKYTKKETTVFDIITMETSATIQRCSQCGYEATFDYDEMGKKRKMEVNSIHTTWVNE